MTTKQALSLILAMLISLPSYAQSNYRRGYVITHENDTVHGWIDYRTDQMNAMVCNFKITLEDNAQTFFPGQIPGFRYVDDGKFYISRVIKLNKEQRTVFLEYLLQGIMNLYYYEDITDNMGYYCFEDGDGEMTIVTKKEDEIISLKGRLVNKQDIIYKGVIDYLFRDYEPLKKDVQNLNFSHTSMINLTKDYHNLVCTTGEPCIEFETKQDKHPIKYKFSIYGGVQWPHFKDENRLPEFSQAYPLIGGRVAVSTPRKLKSLSFITDVAVSKFQFKEYESWSSETYYLDEALNLNVAIGGNYTYHKGLVRPMAEAGLSSYFLTQGFGFSMGYFVGAGLHFKVGKEHFITCAAAYTVILEDLFWGAKTADFIQLKAGFIF